MVGVETGKRKRGSFLALLVMLMILLHTTHCGATSSIMKDNATSPYHGRMDEPDWMFDSEISRMLIGNGGVTPEALKAEKAVIDKKCKGLDVGYRSCLPHPNPSPQPNKCGPYNRYC